MDSIFYKSACTLVKLQEANQINASEILHEYKARINEVNPKVNAIVGTNWDQAENQAKEIDSYRDQHHKLSGLLHGVPFTAKDMADIVGFATTVCSITYKDHRPKKDAEFVSQLKESGAIPMGKTNLPEYAMALHTDNELFGKTNNPFNLNTNPGGSSGGSVAAVASGLTCFDIGSDGGSSIRVPAHFCGVYGHKPTFDLVSMKGLFPPGDTVDFGSFTPAGDMAVNGPITRYAEDLELVMRILARQRRHLNSSSTFKLPEARHSNIKNYRVGVWMENPDFPLDPQVEEKLQNAIKAIENAGATIITKKPEVDLKQLSEMYVIMSSCLAYAGFPKELLYKKGGIVPPEEDPSNNHNRLNWKSSTISHSEWIMYDGIRSMIKKILYEYFENVDVLLTPCAPITAFEHHNLKVKDHWINVQGKKMLYGETIWPWMSLAGLTDAPATSAPVGLARNGLPVGIQIVGRYLDDLTTIKFSELLAHEIGGFVAPKL